MNQATGIGITERVIYGLVAALITRYGKYFGLSETDAPWVAGGLIMLVGGTRAWYVNRPEKLLDNAAAQLPNNATLVIQVPPQASPADKKVVEDLGAATSPKVQTKIAA